MKLGELLSPARTKLELASEDRESVLRELVDQIPELAEQAQARQVLLRRCRNANSFTARALERESLCRIPATL